MPNPPYFGQGNPGPPTAFPPSTSHSNSLKGVSNGRRSPSSPQLANGIPSSKSNGSWMNPGMGSFQVGSNGKGSDRDARVHDDDERRENE